MFTRQQFAVAMPPPTSAERPWRAAAGCSAFSPGQRLVAVTRPLCIARRHYDTVTHGMFPWSVTFLGLW